MGRGRLGGWGRGCGDECGSWCRWRRQQAQGRVDKVKQEWAEPRRQEKPWRKRRRPSMHSDGAGKRARGGSRGSVKNTGNVPFPTALDPRVRWRGERGGVVCGATARSLTRQRPTPLHFPGVRRTGCHARCILTSAGAVCAICHRRRQSRACTTTSAAAADVYMNVRTER